VNMEQNYIQLKKQDLLDKLTELAQLLCAGRRIDPNTKKVRNQLEAIQIEIESMRGGHSPYNTSEDVGK
jgi:hypothetical protein